MSETPRLRLHVPADLGPFPLTLGKEQSHYLANVMRARAGEEVLVFNGRDGEWRGRLDSVGKNAVVVALEAQTRPQAPEPDLWLVAAPIKKDRIDLVAEKASELGAGLLWPVFTRRTVMSRVNTERLEAHMREAAEQCERLSVPEIREPVALDKALSNWDASRTLLFLDESGSGQPLAQVLADIPEGPLAVLVGPEGGFAPEERALLARLPFARPVGLGPRILRAETAAIAALAIVQAVKGDWARAPRG
ncbi:MAG TPA: 16S rRNA (uracil(1498)-N(3))-methyltransferase [Magnetospirillum sp.]|jgi:16S rRNA (uracil1498-N3)-methyltransferase|nr:16S rRNA (uracil(1498)-N(3))-methyltransferase [Magnetospirillum sp.]